MCKVLIEGNEVFGLSITPSVVGAPLQRGEWLGITLAVAQPDPGETDPDPDPNYEDVDSATYDINGTPVLVTRDPQDSLGNSDTVTANILGRKVSLPWRSQISGTTTLLAAKFRTADFLVIRDADNGASPSPQWRLWVFDLRGAGPPPVVPLGPFDVPFGVDLNVCPNGNGQLLLLWHGTQAGAAQGRRAFVLRTEVETRVVPMLVYADDPAATGTIGAEIDAAGRQITLFDAANRGSTMVSRTPNSRNLGQEPLPAPGKLKLTPQSLTLGTTDDLRLFSVENVGGDFLSLDGLSVDNPAVVTARALDAPPDGCIPPRASFSVEVDRVSAQAASAMVTVATTPAASPQSSGRVAVDVRPKPVTPPNPKLSVRPAALAWRTGHPDPLPIVLTNTGNVALDVRVDAPGASDGFSWAALPLTTIAAASSPVIITVQPRATGPDEGSLVVQAFLRGTSTAVPGFPVTVSLKKNAQAKVPAGSLRITSLVADPAGSDILPEGEFIEIANVTTSPLDLEGMVIMHELRGPTDAPRPPRRPLVQFDGNAFGDNSLLQPFAVDGRPLRVLTRAKTPDEPVDRLRFYCGRRSPVWNNTGDTARIINEFGELVDTFDYVTSYAADGSTPAGAHVVLPAAKHRVATRRVFVDARTDWTTVFSVLDGDLLHVRDVTGTISLGGFFGSSGTSGPNGRPGTSAPGDSPCPGVPNFCLIGCVGYIDGDGAVKAVVPPFFVGSDGVVTVTVDQTGLTFFLGVNDSVLSDNGGAFDAAVDLTR